MQLILILILSFIGSLSYGQIENTEIRRIKSEIDSTKSPELVLSQIFTIKAPVALVWEAYTTKSGWENWAVPLAEVELKVGGYIKTNYNKSGKIGDSSTIVTHIINYVPEKILTLQSEITENFPEFMKKEAEDFYNVIYLHEIEENLTRVESYGIGYKKTPKYLELMNYFIPANERTLMNLIKYLEK
ncbi:MAG: SRPBCC domain-containing protein [Saprospiraceae bacterium]|nr:SRPBCC domain-containing protein [Saprospiraceae bacterium]